MWLLRNTRAEKLYYFVCEKKTYYAYFKVKLGDHDKGWAPHVVYNTCVEGLRHWYQGTRSSMPFGIPMVWREPQNHYDCYFCLCNVSGCNKKKAGIKYPNLSSAIRPMPHGPDDPIPAAPAQLEDVESSSSSEQKMMWISHQTTKTALHSFLPKPG
jgi:hypothetical protein